MSAFGNRSASWLWLELELLRPDDDLRDQVGNRVTDPSARRTILVVAGTDELRGYVRRGLERCGRFRVVDVSARALCPDAMRAMLPSVVVMAVGGAGMGAAGVAPWVEGGSRAVPILYLADESAETVPRRGTPVMDRVLRTPFHTRELCHAIREMAELHHERG